MHPLINFAKKYKEELIAVNLCWRFRQLFLPKATLKEKQLFYESLGLKATDCELFFNGANITTMDMPSFINLLKNVPYGAIYKGKK